MEKESLGQEAAAFKAPNGEPEKSGEKDLSELKVRLKELSDKADKWENVPGKELADFLKNEGEVIGENTSRVEIYELRATKVNQWRKQAMEISNKIDRLEHEES